MKMYDEFGKMCEEITLAKIRICTTIVSGEVGKETITN
jgi:hypothetical protein